MALPVTIPNTFANATAAIPLSQLDANFNTLSNAVNGLNSGSETLANLKATTANVVTLTVTGNATIGDASTDTVTLNSTLTANTAVIFSAGTSAAPSITFTSDTNTGIFSPAADTIAFTEGGAEAMRIDSSGNVGIGTTSPLLPLHVVTTGTGTAMGDNASATFRSGASGRASTIQLSDGTNSNYVSSLSGALGFGTGSTERMRIDSSGNVGIGTTSPNIGSANADNAILTLKGKASTRGSIFELANFGTTANDQTLGWNRYFDGSTENANIEVARASSTSTAYMKFSTNGGSGVTERMRIDSSGNVTGANTTGMFRLANSARSALLPTYAFVNAADVGMYNPADGTLGFVTGQVERARITSGGYFKATSTGTYISSTGAYHEFRTDNSGLYVSTASGSQTSDNIVSRSARAANSAYRFFAGESSDGSDVEFNLRGDGNGYADGTWNNNGADYAEYFESANGEALTLGATVVLDGNKVRDATAQDPASAIIGVVRPKEPSKASMVVGNTAWNKWANKYLTDDFDRYIMEDHDVVEWEEQSLEKEATEAVVDEEGNEVSPAQEATYKTIKHSYESHNIPEGITVPEDATVKTHDDKNNKFQHYKLNPAWDKDSEYTPREQRPEWNIIGLVGQVKVLKGQPTNDRWVKMRDVSANVEEWFIR